jgi:glycosyltransferase involved in cell wall biosynthesis
MNSEANSSSLVFFVPSLDGGVGRVTMLLALGMQASGKKVEVWSVAPKSGYAYELERTLLIRYIGDGTVSSSFLPLIRKLRKHTPTTLISASFHANCIALLASIFAHTQTQFAIADHPSVDAALQEFSFLKRILWRILIFILYPIADKHIAVSKGVAKAMSKYGRVDLSKITVIPNPVITDEIFIQASIPTHHPFFDANEPTLLYVGRLSYEKDISNLIYAFKYVQDKVSSRLIIVGDGPDRRSLEEIVHQENIEDRVSFLGHQINPYPYFSQSDLFVLSSTREGLPTVLIEALAFGLKVVSTDCPSGPREILNDGAYGQLVRLGDSTALADSIISLLKSSAPKIPKSALEKYTVKSAVYKYMKTLCTNSKLCF